MRKPISRPPYSLSSSMTQLPESSAPSAESVSKRDSIALSRTTTSREKKLVLLVTFLALAAIACFSVAYYLFTTSRWATPSTLDFRNQVSDPVPPQAATHDDFSVVSNVDSILNINSMQLKADVGGERYLSYLPHSGFHNQRIALENALVLSRLLNRTLLVPPIRLGRKAINYDNFTMLQETIDNDFVFFSQCDNQAQKLTHEPASSINQNCVADDDIRARTYLPWDWLTDFAKVRSEQQIIDRWNLSSGWIASHLKVPSSQILTLSDTTVYHYQFVEGVAKSESHRSRSPTYLESVNTAFLLAHPARLIQLGSLFGSSRLKLSLEHTRAIRKDIRRHMVFTQPVLVDISSRIHDKLGGEYGNGYLGAHVRLNDLLYRRTAENNTRLIWWKLVHGILNLTLEETKSLEAKYAKYEAPSSPPILEPISMSESGLLPPFSPANSSSLAVKPMKPCRGKLHTKQNLLPLNVPLFIATDAKDPIRHRHLSLFRHTFPCTFFLQDFHDQVETITGMRNPMDGFDLTEFLVPFLDAMVVSKARRVVGTRHSTFSWFVHDILWRRYYGLDIEERNGGR
jgi:GDP-fucose protein O-fucosyltransferase